MRVTVIHFYPGYIPVNFVISNRTGFKYIAKMVAIGFCCQVQLHSSIQDYRRPEKVDSFCKSSCEVSEQQYGNHYGYVTLLNVLYNRFDKQYSFPLGTGDHLVYSSMRIERNYSEYQPVWV